MSLLNTLSEKTLFGSSLGFCIFIYGFILAFFLLGIGVTKYKRKLSAFSYILAQLDLIYLIVFFNYDMYKKLAVLKRDEIYPAYGCGVISGIVDICCVVAIAAIFFAIKRLKKNKAYTL